MARRFASNRNNRGPRRVSSWIEIPIIATNVSGSSSLIAALDAGELARRPFTIVRTHLEVLIRSDQLIADEIQLGAVGLAVVTDQARAVGVTAVPTPVSDDNSDSWFVHQFLFSSFAFISGVGFDSGDGRNYTIDSKAMRKVTDSDDVVVVVEGSTVGDGLQIIVGGRVLIKEA